MFGKIKEKTNVLLRNAVHPSVRRLNVGTEGGKRKSDAHCWESGRVTWLMGLLRRLAFRMLILLFSSGRGM